MGPSVFQASKMLTPRQKCPPRPSDFTSSARDRQAMSRPAPAPTSSACYCETPKTAGFGCGFLPLDSFFLSLLPMIRTPYEFATETISDQMSIRAFKALDSMKARRGSTSSPISVVKISSAAMASSIWTRNSRRALGSIVVSQSCSGFISPRPL